MLPPGWMTARMPAFAASSTLSRKGKKASEAIAAPCAVSPAFFAAICTESTRLIWPAPIPTVRSAVAKTIAFERTWRTIAQAKRIACHSSSVG